MLLKGVKIQPSALKSRSFDVDDGGVAWILRAILLILGYFVLFHIQKQASPISSLTSLRTEGEKD